MTSQTHGRLGDQRTAERLATRVCGDGGDVWRLCLARRRAESVWQYGGDESPSRAYAAYARAVRIFEDVGDVRGQARSYGNLGIAAQFEARLDEAAEAYGRAIVDRSVGRDAGSFGASRR